MNHKPLSRIVYLITVVASASGGIVLSNALKTPSSLSSHGVFHVRNALIPRQHARINTPFHGPDRKDHRFIPHSFPEIAAPRLRLSNSMRNAGDVAFA